MKKIGLICLALVLALGTIGVGYAMWDKTLYIDGTVNTGNVNAIFTTASSDDVTGIDPGHDKDVGSCIVTGAGGQRLTITIDNGYPCYTATINFTIDNTGTIPVKIEAFNITNDPFPDVTVDWAGVVLGTQIEPGGEVPGSIIIHVEQTADESAQYIFNAEIWLVQWNESAY